MNKRPFYKLISKLVVGAVLPYFIFSWILLSVILFVQQASRYSDIFFNANLPAHLIWQLTFALIPNVIAFTCPMAFLVGVIIGLTKMQSDNELTAVRAAGVGNLQIVLPIFLIGVALTLFSFLINWKGVPLAAQMVRKIALQTALFKIDSPIEPGVFNNEIWGYTIYVKNGDVSRGVWENILIFHEDKNNGQMRLITAKNGRIDVSGDDSELVLAEALVSSFSIRETSKPVVFESVKNLRFVVQTKRSEIIGRLSKTEETPEELGLTELAAFARNKEGKERTEAEILWQRRIILSITPLLFAFLGASLVLRFNRGGRGFGILLALLSLIGYYLLALMGEQLARTQRISVLTAGLIPLAVSVGLIVWFFFSQKLSSGHHSRIFTQFREYLSSKIDYNRRTKIFPTVATGILDFDIITSLIRYFLLTGGFLLAIYVIFTAFELWRFTGALDNGFSILAQYIFYLLPYIYIQLAPSCLMVATLATFVIKSRQNEVVTWTAAGLSIYRLLLPCFLFMALIGLVNWQIQEKVLPQTNRVQDKLRSQIRGRGILAAREGKIWAVSSEENKIFSFELNSDEMEGNQVKNLYIFEFDKAEHLQSLIVAEKALWQGRQIELHGTARKTVWRDNGTIETVELAPTERFLPKEFDPFREIYTKPTHLTARETAERLKASGSVSERRMYAVALERKYTTLVLPFIITLFTAPFALSLSRKGKALTVGYAVAVWLIFIGISNTFEQMGLNGYIDPQIAVWGPLILFTLIGGFLISRART